MGSRRRSVSGERDVEKVRRIGTEDRLGLPDVQEGEVASILRIQFERVRLTAQGGKVPGGRRGGVMPCDRVRRRCPKIIQDLIIGGEIKADEPFILRNVDCEGFDGETAGCGGDEVTPGLQGASQDGGGGFCGWGGELPFEDQTTRQGDKRQDRHHKEERFFLHKVKHRILEGFKTS